MLSSPAAFLQRPLTCACAGLQPTEWSDSEWQEWRQAQLPSRFKGDLHWRFVALACLFLAGKVEDNPKKIYDVVNQFYADVPKREMLVDPEISDKHIRELKETLFAYERLVMQELDFDMIVEAPIAFNQVAQYISFMRTSLHTAARSPIAGLPVMSAPDDPAILDPDTLQIVGLALEFMENSLLTTLWLEYDGVCVCVCVCVCVSMYVCIHTYVHTCYVLTNVFVLTL